MRFEDYFTLMFQRTFHRSFAVLVHYRWRKNIQDQLVVQLSQSKVSRVPLDSKEFREKSNLRGLYPLRLVFKTILFLLKNLYNLYPSKKERYLVSIKVNLSLKQSYMNFAHHYLSYRKKVAFFYPLVTEMFHFTR